MRTVNIKEDMTDHVVISLSLAELGRLYWAAKNHKNSGDSIQSMEDIDNDANILGEILRERGRVDAAETMEDFNYVGSKYHY